MIFAKEEIFNDSPLDQAHQFEKLGFKNLHIVDLDRTLDSKSSNLNSIEEIAIQTSLKIQVGGGVRASTDGGEVGGGGASGCGWRGGGVQSGVLGG